ncbi:amino acid ABC transporter substrate-binding protein (PAAT family) [Promicromonospora sp. AC04]|uniref:ABC transporter substrate-binding protein n=1 Tax=Promicromonospora sp. AC04 TaxID=2135723 RepID=UPI000D33D079|nr:ABC transporter substrate-binding protein [Promicromonospora sp. AC04]PUB22235.1 amino acid ABC transporter substrate-binding protein (PAAT family) [Promicromonospora sp. AC04]
MALGYRVRAVISSVAATAVLGGLLTGCSIYAPDEPTEAAEQVEVHEELRAMLPGELRAESTRITVGTESGYPPFEYTNQAGRIVGFEIDLFDAASDRLGLKYNFQDMPWDSLVDELYASNVDAVAAAMSDTAERQADSDFVDYYNDSDAIMVPAGNPEGIKTLKDLCGRTVAVLVETTQAAALTALNVAQCQTQPVNVVTFETDADALAQVQAGKADAELTQWSTGTYNAKQVGSGDVFEVANTEIINPTPLGFRFLKGDVELVRAYQAALQSLIDDGTYGEILKKHDLSEGALTKATVNNQEQ